MTVRDLIRHLDHAPLDAEVAVYDGNYDREFTLESVEARIHGHETPPYVVLRLTYEG